MASLFDLPTVDRLGVELPVEIGERTAFRKACILNPALDRPFAPAIGLLTHDTGQELQRSETFLLGARQVFVEALLAQRNAEDREVGQYALP
ncbi:MAG: hypothetical protein HY000_30995 [Planctomycetes bacterium]|nr:hypothetical protein [Planctomycetota bacterium]